MSLDDDELDPLEVIALPVDIEAYEPDVRAPSTVRLFFRMPGGVAAEPGGDLADVVILEAWDRVAIGLVRRWLTGDSPDGERGYGGEKMIDGKKVALDVVLAEPLGERPLLDASTGETVPARRSDDPEPVAIKDTPVWRA